MEFDFISKIEFEDIRNSCIIVIEDEGINVAFQNNYIQYIGTIAATTCTIMFIVCKTTKNVGCFHVTDSSDPYKLKSWIDSFTETSADCYLLGGMSGYKSSLVQKMIIDDFLSISPHVSIIQDIRGHPFGKSITCAAMDTSTFQIVTWKDIHSPLHTCPFYTFRSSRGLILAPPNNSNIKKNSQKESKSSTEVQVLLEGLMFGCPHSYDLQTIELIRNIPENYFLAQFSTTPDAEPPYFRNCLLEVLHAHAANPEEFAPPCFRVQVQLRNESLVWHTEPTDTTEWDSTEDEDENSDIK